MHVNKTVVYGALLTTFVVASSVVVNLHQTERKAFAQVSSTPATIMAAVGTPASNGLACGVGQASSASTSLFDQRDITSGNSIWKCKLGTDGVTYAWQAPFVAATPAILGSTTSIGGSLLVLGGSVSGTTTVAGAIAGNNCIATPSDGTILSPGLVIDCYVTGSGTNNVTVRISAAVAGTPPAKTYNIKVFP